VRTAIFHPLAKIDIREIWDWIAKDNEQAADRVEAAIYFEVARLVKMPGIGHRRADVKISSYLFFNVYSYAIAYEYDDVSLTVVRVLHGARNFRALFKDA
jgi:toxin ParE1/3/4